MRKTLIITTAILATTAGTAAAKLAPLVAPLRMTTHSPTRIAATISSSKPTVVGIWRINCGASRSSGRYTARSGQTVALTLPTDHTGTCVLHLTGEIQGYGSIHEHATSRSQAR